MLEKADLEGLFLELGEMARADEKIVEIAVYGGAALILSFPARPATRDVDIVMHGDAAWIRWAAARIKDAHGEDLDDDWLNDGVKGFLSAQDGQDWAKRLFRSYPSEDEPGLRVFVATPEYLLAMKCMAMRLGGAEGSHDKGDIIALIGDLGLETPEQTIQIVSRYYPRERIAPKTAFGIEEIFDMIRAKRGEAGEDAWPWQP